MSKEMREQINKVKNFGQFLNENIVKTITKKGFENIVYNVSQINTVKDMKEQILKVAKDLEQGTITDIEAQNLLLCLFGVSGSFISVNEQEPPHNIELLAKSPTGTVHLCSWRPAYNIFTCQAKGESSWNWGWKLI